MVNGSSVQRINPPIGGAFEKCLEGRPNRYNSLYGAGLAAKESGDMTKAKAYFTKVIELEGATPSKRERSKQAREIVGQG